MVNTAFITPSSCKKQINKQNSYFLLTFLQSGSVPEQTETKRHFTNLHETKLNNEIHQSFGRPLLIL
jgi:hypothetical protein